MAFEAPATSMSLMPLTVCAPVPPPFITSTRPVPEVSPSTDELVGARGVAAEIGGEVEHAALAHIVAGDGQARAGDLPERDPAGVGEARDALVEVGEIERAAGRDGVGRGGAEARPRRPPPACRRCDGRGAGVAVRAAEDGRAGAGLAHGAGAADRAGEGVAIGAVEDERAVVDDVAGDRARRCRHRRAAACRRRSWCRRGRLPTPVITMGARRRPWRARRRRRCRTAG